MVLDDGRTVFVTAPGAPTPAALERPFVCLVPALAPPDEAELPQLLLALVKAGCGELVFAGPAHPHFHDAADELLEEQGHFSVLTSGNADPVDTCAYFLFAAGGGLPGLLALAADAPELVAALHRAVEHYRGER